MENNTAQEAVSSSPGDAPAEAAAETDAAKNSKSKKKKKKRSAAYYAVTFFIKIGLTVLAVWVLLTYVGGISMCHDNSAYPMIKDGDLILTYRLDDYRQGDVAVYKRDDTVHFGRVIAFSGDTVDISGEYVTVNGYGLYEDAVYPTSVEGAAVNFPYTVPENSIFVLNDYRSNINDSRTYGAIPVDDTEGKAVFVMRRRGI